MDLFHVIITLSSVLHFGIINALPIGKLGPLDQFINLKLLNFSQGKRLVEGLVLAETIVEGGPVYDRPRKILGGRHVHPGLNHLKHGPSIESCPPFALGYTCLDWVPEECQVVRHLFSRSRLCTCKVNVCNR